MDLIFGPLESPDSQLSNGAKIRPNGAQEGTFKMSSSYGPFPDKFGHVPTMVIFRGSGTFGKLGDLAGGAHFGPFLDQKSSFFALKFGRKMLWNYNSLSKCTY